MIVNRLITEEVVVHESKSAVILELELCKEHLPDSDFTVIALENELPWAATVWSEGLLIVLFLEKGRAWDRQQTLCALSELFGHTIVFRDEHTLVIH